jgi:hypothetical protein
VDVAAAALTLKRILRIYVTCVVSSVFMKEKVQTDHGSPFVDTAKCVCPGGHSS